MKTQRFFRNAGLTTLLISSIPAGGRAATVIWGGGTGEYTAGANWTGGNVPNTNGGDTAQINGGSVTYTPGGDLAIHNGGSLQINGGSWTQAGGIAWIQLAGGTLSVNGGTFNQGSSANIVKDASTVISVSAGTANFNDNLVYNPTSTGSLLLTGGTINVANEFKPITTYTVGAGALNANLISFADGPGGIEFSGGTISVNGAGAYSGFYGGGTKSLNFTAGSTGALFISNYTLTELTADHFLTNGTIRHDGAISESSFSTTEAGGGVWIALVPEADSSLYLISAIGTLLLCRKRHA